MASLHAQPRVLCLVSALLMVVCNIQAPFTSAFLIRRPFVHLLRSSNPYALLSSAAAGSSHVGADALVGIYTYDTLTSQWTPATQLSKDQSPLCETWRWCQDFVVPLQLCPWAAASVTTPKAMQFYVLPATSPVVTKDQLTKTVQEVAEHFYDNYLRQNNENENDEVVDLRKVAIAFLILADSSEKSSSPDFDHWTDDFPSFYDWFVQLEDDWIDQGYDDLEEKENEEESIYNACTLAAFHPNWKFGTDNDKSKRISGLDFEKKSPFPTITVVSTHTIDAAGPEATERIAQHNEQVLQNEMTGEQVQALYQQAVWRKKEPEESCP